MDKPLTRLIKKKNKKVQSKKKKKISKKIEVTSDTTEIQDYKKICANKLDDLKKNG